MTPPTEFFAPAPLRRPGVMPEAVERRYRRSQNATLSTLRVVAALAGLGLLVMLVINRGRWQFILDPGAWSFARADTWFGVALGGSALLVIAAAARHRWSGYLFSFRLAGGVYLTAVSCQLAGQLAGAPVLESLNLADFAGYPAVFLLLSLPRLGMPVALGMMAVVSGTNQGFPPTIANLIEVAWGLVIVVPFLLLVRAALRTAERIDREANRRYAENLQLVRSKALLDTEARFLGYLHDRVLHHLASIRRGLIKPEPLTVQPPDETTSGPKPLSVSVSQAVVELGRALHRIDPTLPLALPTKVYPRATLPAEALSLISDAALAALDNSCRHAPQSRRWGEVEMVADDDGTVTAFTVTLHDDGPGFNPADIAPERAGVRVAILGRMAAVPGLAAHIDSAPGSGTSVKLNWQREEVGKQPTAAAEPERDFHEITDLGTMFSPVFAGCVAAVILLKGLGHDHSQHPGYFVVSLALAAIALAALARGRYHRLPLRPTLVAAVSIPAFALVASLENIGFSQWWPPVWYSSVFTYLCLLLALRGRAGVAWLMMISGSAAMVLLAQGGPVSTYLTVAKMMGMATLLVPITLLPMALRWMISALTAVLREDSTKDTDLEVAASRRSYLTDSVSWLQRQLDTVLAPERSPADRVRDAHLLELQLRDVIRSPGFDHAATNREVWLARSRGVVIRLRDDRCDAHGEDPAPQPAAHADLHHRLQQLLATAEGEITARIFPVGRAGYASIMVDAGAGQKTLGDRLIIIPTDSALEEVSNLGEVDKSVAGQADPAGLH